MAGRTPLNNAKFINSPDFNSYGVTGASGGSFHGYTSGTGGSEYTLSTADISKVIRMSGNSELSIPNTIVASPGDEVMVFSPTGTVKLTPLTGVTLADNNYNVAPTARPARLINTGTNSWRVAGYKFAYFPFSAVNCCGVSVPTIYQYSTDFTNGSTAYADNAGQTLYSVIDPYLTYNSVDYSILDGVVTVSTCPSVDFNIPYTFYDVVGTPVDLYTWASISVLSPDVYLYKFKLTTVIGAFPCNTESDAVGTYYRTYIDFVLGDPVCIDNGYVISETTCA